MKGNKIPSNFSALGRSRAKCLKFGFCSHCLKTFCYSNTSIYGKISFDEVTNYFRTLNSDIEKITLNLELSVNSLIATCLFVCSLENSHELPYNWTVSLYSTGNSEPFWETSWYWWSMRIFKAFSHLSNVTCHVKPFWKHILAINSFLLSDERA